VIDETEFQAIFNGMEESWNSHAHNIIHSVLRDRNQARTSTVDIDQARNTIDKLAGTKFTEYPFFSKQNKKNAKRTLTERPLSSTRKPERSLSIFDKDGVSAPDNYRSSVTANQFESEYSSNFRKRLAGRNARPQSANTTSTR